MNYTFIIDIRNKNEAETFLNLIGKTDIKHNNALNLDRKICDKVSEYFIFKNAPTSTHTYLGWSFDYSGEDLRYNYYVNYYCKKPIRISLDAFFKVAQYKNNRRDMYRALCKLEGICKTTNVESGTTIANPWL